MMNYAMHSYCEIILMKQAFENGWKMESVADQPICHLDIDVTNRVALLLNSTEYIYLFFDSRFSGLRALLKDAIRLVGPGNYYRLYTMSTVIPTYIIQHFNVFTLVGQCRLSDKK